MAHDNPRRRRGEVKWEKKGMVFLGGWVECWVGESCRSQKRRDEPLIGWVGMGGEEEGEGKD